jgi:hypothetical protein
MFGCQRTLNDDIYMKEANTTFVLALTYSTHQLGRTSKTNDLVMHPQFRVKLLSEPNAYASSM